MSKLYYLDNLSFINLKDTCACIGFFDGVHKGHQKLINKTLTVSKKYNLKSALITFDPDPNEIITNKKIIHISDFETRFNLISNYKLDYIFVVKFNKSIMNMSIDSFNNFLSFNLNIKRIVCGFDFTYGRYGKGNAYSLKEYYGNKCYVVNEVKYKGNKISSTNVKNEFKNNNIKLVNKYLGYDYYVEGIVEKGKQIGRKINFPTSNIKLNETLVLNQGVYFGYVIIRNKKYKAMINYGYNPTVNSSKLKLEVYIDGFKGNLYNKILRVYFKDYSRNEIKFNSIEDLHKQLSIDLNNLRKANV